MDNLIEELERKILMLEHDIRQSRINNQAERTKMQNLLKRTEHEAEKLFEALESELDRGPSIKAEAALVRWITFKKSKK